MVQRFIRRKRRGKPRPGGKQVSHTKDDTGYPVRGTPVPVDVDTVSQEQDEEFVQELTEQLAELPPKPEPPPDRFVKEHVVPQEPPPPTELIEEEVEGEVPECYVVIDFEATCFQKRLSRDETEIIEFAAILVDKETMAPLDEFNYFVKPVIHPELSDYCLDLTGISQSDVDEAFRFPTVLRQFKSWLAKTEGKKVFCSWGEYDRIQLEMECERNNEEYPFSGDHINVKELFSEVKKYKRKYSLTNAMKRLKLSFEGSRHRAIDDARNIVRVMKTLAATEPF